MQLTIFMSTSSLQYTILRCQEYICSAVKLSQFLQYLPKHALWSSSCFATLKDQQSGLDMERWLTPQRTSTYKRPFTQEGNYLVTYHMLECKFQYILLSCYFYCNLHHEIPKTSNFKSKQGKMKESGDVVAKWIAHGTLNAKVMGLNLSAASWLTMCSTCIWVVPNSVKKSGECAVMSLWLVHIKEHVCSIRIYPTTLQHDNKM